MIQMAQENQLHSFLMEQVHAEFDRIPALREKQSLQGHVTEVLIRFQRMDALYCPPCGDMEIPFSTLNSLLESADSIFGTASSFDAEYKIRGYLGDFLLFMTGMYPECIPGHPLLGGRKLDDVCRIGWQSYYIASQLECFDPIVAKKSVLQELYNKFHECRYGLSRVRSRLH